MIILNGSGNHMLKCDVFMGLLTRLSKGVINYFKVNLEELYRFAEGSTNLILEFQHNIPFLFLDRS